MLSQRGKQQPCERNKIKKVLKLTEDYDGKFHSFKKFRLKNVTKFNNKIQSPKKLSNHYDNDGKLIRSLTQVEQCKQNQKNSFTYKSNLLNQIQKLHQNEAVSTTPNDKTFNLKQVDNHIYYFIRDFRQKNLSEFSQSKVSQKNQTLKLLKNNLERKRYCQYRWGSNSPSNNSNTKNIFKKQFILNSFEKVSSQRKSTDSKDKILIGINNEEEEQQSQKLPKSIETQFYKNAKQTIKQRIKHKIWTKKRLCVLQDSPTLKIQEINSSRLQIIQQHSSQVQRKIILEKTPKYCQQDLNAFLYDTINYEDQKIQKEKIVNEIQRKNSNKQYKIALKFKKIRQQNSKNKVQYIVKKCGGEFEQGFSKQENEKNKLSSSNSMLSHAESSHKRHSTLEY